MKTIYAFGTGLTSALQVRHPARLSSSAREGCRGLPWYRELIQLRCAIPNLLFLTEFAMLYCTFMAIDLCRVSVLQRRAMLHRTQTPTRPILRPHVSGIEFFSGMRPNRAFAFGATTTRRVKNPKLQHEHPRYFFVADWQRADHPLRIAWCDWSTPSTPSSTDCGRRDPAQATLFVQSKVPQHAELTVLMSFFTSALVAGAGADLQGLSGQARNSDVI